MGRETQPDRRLGTELSDHAKRHGAGGIFHTDELPAYGVTEAEVESLREAVDAGPEDAVAIVADDPETAELAIDAVAERAESALAGVPEETRGANDDGTTRYLRPLPGAARMYPETDVPPVDPTRPTSRRPELLTEKVDRYESEFGLDAGLAEQVAYGRRWPLFEARWRATASTDAGRRHAGVDADRTPPRRRARRRTSPTSTCRAHSAGRRRRRAA